MAWPFPLAALRKPFLPPPQARERLTLSVSNFIPRETAGNLQEGAGGLAASQEASQGLCQRQTTAGSTCTFGTGQGGSAHGAVPQQNGAVHADVCSTGSASLSGQLLGGCASGVKQPVPGGTQGWTTTGCRPTE